MFSLAQMVEQWTGNPKAAGSNPVGKQLFRIACFNSGRFGGSFQGFRVGSL